MIYVYDIFLSLRAGGILQILQSGWFREQAVFHDLARYPGRKGKSEFFRLGKSEFYKSDKKSEGRIKQVTHSPQEHR